MTKEEFIKKVTAFCRQWMASRDVDDLEELLDEFFSQNVVIPKGTNRHSDADVFHEWVENQSIQLEWFNNNYEDGVLHNWLTMPSTFIYTDKHIRIKPQEPVYEWQWIQKKSNGYIVGYSTNGLLTEREAFENGMFETEGWVKNEETKRIRK